MTKFQGAINLDIRDSVPDWAPFDVPRAPEGAPNVVCPVYDDRLLRHELLRRTDPHSQHRPHRRRLALVHPVAHHRPSARRPGRVCSPAGTTPATPWRASPRRPPGSPTLAASSRPRTAPSPRFLEGASWNTYAVGKWHLCPEAEMNLASTRRNWPTGRGFERFYGFLGAETNQWYPDLVYDNHTVDQPNSPEEGYHFSVDITDKALEFIKDSKVLAPDKPFLLYYAPRGVPRPPSRPQSVDREIQGSVRHGLRGAARPDPGPPNGARHPPPGHGPLARQSDRDARHPDRPRWAALPRPRHRAAVGDAVRRREATLLPDGRGLRRVPGPCRRSDRPAPRLPGGDRPTREHHGRGGLGQRGQRRGRTRRIGERVQVS